MFAGRVGGRVCAGKGCLEVGSKWSAETDGENEMEMDGRWLEGSWMRWKSADEVEVSGCDGSQRKQSESRSSKRLKVVESRKRLEGSLK